MFEATKNSMKRNKQLRQFKFLVDAATVIPDGATVPVGFGLLPEKDASELAAVEPNLVSINPSVPVDANGNLQVAVTPLGLEAFKTADGSATPASNTAANTAVAGETATFEILKGVPMPAIQRGGGAGRESKYPFAQLEVGDAFDVPTTSKQFASQISGQNRKYKGERQFTVRTIKAGIDGAKFDGVRVWRITPTPPKPPKQPAA